MNSYFPYNETEWAEIVEQAFSPDAYEPEFSKAYQRRKRRMERKLLRKPMSVRKRIWCVAAAVSAAVLCVFFGTSVATSSSLGQGVSDFFHGRPTEDHKMQSITVEPTEVETSANILDTFTITHETALTYFDGTYLKMTLCLFDLPEALQNSTSVSAPITAALDGIPLTFPEISGSQEVSRKSGYLASLSEQAAGQSVPEEMNLAVFRLCNDGKYRTDLLAECPGQTGDTSILRISFSYFQGQDERTLKAYAYHDDGSINYEAVSLGTVAANRSYQTNIVRETDAVQQYEVNETQNGYTLKRVRISPVCTSVEIDGAFTANDTLSVMESGAVYCDLIENPAQEAWDYHYTLWQPPGTTAQELKIYLMHYNMQPSDESGKNPAFVIPIRTVPQLPEKSPEQCPAEYEHIYDPPLTAQ